MVMLVFGGGNSSISPSDLRLECSEFSYHRRVANKKPSFRPLMYIHTLPETNSSHLKMDGWKMSFLFGMSYFQVRTVSFREGNHTCTSSYLRILYLRVIPQLP